MIRRRDQESVLSKCFLDVELLSALPDGQRNGSQFARNRNARQFWSRSLVYQALVVNLDCFVAQRRQRRAFEYLFELRIVIAIQSACRNLLPLFDNLPLDDLVVGA